MPPSVMASEAKPSSARAKRCGFSSADASGRNGLGVWSRRITAGLDGFASLAMTGEA